MRSKGFSVAKGVNEQIVLWSKLWLCQVCWDAMCVQLLRSKMFLWVKYSLVQSVPQPYYPECVSFVFWEKLRLNNFVSRLTDLYQFLFLTFFFSKPPRPVFLKMNSVRSKHLMANSVLINLVICLVLWHIHDLELYGSSRFEIKLLSLLSLIQNSFFSASIKKSFFPWIYFFANVSIWPPPPTHLFADVILEWFQTEIQGVS